MRGYNVTACLELKVTHTPCPPLAQFSTTDKPSISPKYRNSPTRHVLVQVRALYLVRQNRDLFALIPIEGGSLHPPPD